jgi:uncharacterized protein
MHGNVGGSSIEPSGKPVSSSLDSVPRTSFRLPFGLGFADALRADSYDTDNLAVGQTTSDVQPSGVYLGKLAEFQQMRRNVWLDCHGAHAVYVIGKRRSGKSYTLGVLCEGLVSNNWLRLGVPDQAVLLLDTLNIYGTLHIPAGAGTIETSQWQLPTYTPSVRYVAPEISRSMIAADSIRLTVDPAWLTLEDWCGFFDFDPFADPPGHLLGIILDAARRRWQVQSAGATDSNSRSGVADILAALDNHPDAQQFETSTREAVRRRLLAMERLNFLSRPSPTIEELLRPGMITVCQLRDFDERLRALIVAVLVREIMRSRGRADATSRLRAARRRIGEADIESAEGVPRCWLVIDEAHNYLPTTGSLPSRAVLRRLITEGRNVGLSVVVATQQPSGLDASIQRNADALFIHSMSMRDDISAAEGMLNTQVPDSASWGTSEKASSRVFERIVRALPQGYCLVSTDSANRVFGLRVRPRTTMHGGENY